MVVDDVVGVGPVGVIVEDASTTSVFQKSKVTASTATAGDPRH